MVKEIPKPNQHQRLSVCDLWFTKLGGKSAAFSLSQRVHFHVEPHTARSVHNLLQWELDTHNIIHVRIRIYPYIRSSVNHYSAKGIDLFQKSEVVQLYSQSLKTASDYKAANCMYYVHGPLFIITLCLEHYPYLLFALS